MLPRRTARVLSSRHLAERGSQECAVAATCHLDRAPSDADDYWPDLRRGKRRIYGGFLGFIDRARAIGTPYAVVDLAIRVVTAYAREVYGLESSMPTMLQRSA